MSSPLSRETSRAICEAIRTHVGAVVVRKDGGYWSALGYVFDGLRLVGMAVPKGVDVVEHYAQTLPVIPGVKTPFSTVILLPAHEGSPDDEVELIVHEGTHAQQSTGDPAWGIKYLQHAEYRAGTAEAPAFAASLAYRWARTGSLPASLDGIRHVLRDGYSVGDYDALAHDVVEIRATEITHGVIRSELARLAIAITYRDQPDALDAGALALIRAHCPDALVIP